MEQMTFESKVCSICKEDKLLGDYHKQADGRLGVKSSCKTCTSEVKKSRWHKYKSSVKTYRENNKDKIKSYRKEYYAKNKGWYKEYYEENRDYYLQKSKDYQIENPHRAAKRTADYKARKLQAVPEHLAGCTEEVYRVAQVYRLARLFTNVSGKKYEVDHMWPLSKGGPHWSGNLQILLKQDNVRKNNSLDNTVKDCISEGLKYDVETDMVTERLGPREPKTENTNDF